MGAALSVAAIVTQVAAVGLQAYGQYQAGQQASDVAKYEAEIAERNAIRAEGYSVDAIERGRIAEQQQRIRTRQTIGSQRATAAGRGILVDSGSAEALLVDTASIGELDALTVRVNAEREALGFEQRAEDFRSEGELRKYSGRAARQGAALSTTGTLLSGVGTVSDQWYKLYPRE